MKNLATIFFLIFCITELALAQSELENFCGLEDSDMILMSTPADFPGDGQHISSQGTLRVLVVFAKFPISDFGSTTSPLHSHLKGGETEGWV